MLDGFAHAEETLREFEQRYRKLQTLRAEQTALSTAESAREQEIDLLRHQVNEITGAKLSVTEEEEIASRYKLAANSKRLVELAGSIARRLSDADDSILPQLAETQRLLRELEKIDPAQGMLAEAHAASVVELSEISRSLSGYAEQLDLDPEQLAALEERVSLFETLKRKYGGSIAEVISFGERAQERLRKIEGRDEELERLSQEIEKARAEVERTGRALQKLRAKAAPKLSENIRSNLRDLGFRQSEFEAKLTALDQPNATGFDAIELLFSPNPGEPLKPLRAIASSGEISRLMLAIKSSLAAQDAIPLLVFDEIDANVGGEIANAVGAKMRTLGARASGSLHHASAAGGRDGRYAFRCDQGCYKRPNAFAAQRSRREGANRRNCADARRKDRVRAPACREFAEINLNPGSRATRRSPRRAPLHIITAVLNYIWLAFLLIAVIVGGFSGTLPALTKGAFETAEMAVMKIALPLVGIMAIWLGIMRLAERAGLVQTHRPRPGPGHAEAFPRCAARSSRHGLDGDEHRREHARPRATPPRRSASAPWPISRP